MQLRTKYAKIYSNKSLTEFLNFCETYNYFYFRIKYFQINMHLNNFGSPNK